MKTKKSTMSVPGSWVKPCGTRLGIRKGGKGAIRLPKIRVLTWRRQQMQLDLDVPAAAAGHAEASCDAIARGAKGDGKADDAKHLQALLDDPGEH